MPLFKSKKKNSNTGNKFDSLETETFKFKRFKDKGAKDKYVKINDHSIIDDQDKLLIKLKHIKQLSFGKVTPGLLTNKKISKKDNKHFVSIIADEQHSAKHEPIIDLQILKNDRLLFAEIIFYKLAKMNRAVSDTDNEKFAKLKDNPNECLTVGIVNMDGKQINRLIAPADAHEIIIPIIDKTKTSFAVKRYKEKGSKEKMLHLTDSEMVKDERKKPIIKYKHIDKIALGKVTEILKNNKKFSKVSHSRFFSLIDDRPGFKNIDLYCENNRFEIIANILKHLPKQKENLLRIAASYINKDESFTIDISHSNAEIKVKAEEVPIMNKKRDSIKHKVQESKQTKWDFTRHKARGSKQRTIELTDEAIVWDNKAQMKLTDLKCIMFGKESEILKESKKLKDKSNDTFISFKSQKDIWDLCEVHKGDRLVLLSKVLQKLKAMQPSKHIDENWKDIVSHEETAVFVVIDDSIIKGEEIVEGHSQDLSSEEVHAIISNIEESKQSNPKGSGQGLEINDAEIDKDYIAEIAKLKKDYDTLQKRYDVYKQVQKDRIEELTAEITGLEKVKTNYNSEIMRNKQLQTELKEQKNINLEINKKLSVNKERKSEVSLTDLKMQRQMAQLKNERKEHKEIVMELNAQLSKLKSENKSHRGSIVELENKTSKDKHFGKMNKINENKLQKQLKQLQKQRSDDKTKISALKDRLSTLEHENSDYRTSIVQLENKVSDTKRRKSNVEDSEEMMKQIRLNYIESVKSILSDTDWKRFLALLKLVANHSQKLQTLGANMEIHSRDRLVFLEKIVFELHSIFDSYPKSQLHLMNDFEIVIPSQSERFMFVRMITEKTIGIAHTPKREKVNNEKILSEFQEKVKSMKQQIVQQKEVTNFHGIRQKNAHAITAKRQQISPPLFADDSKSEEQNKQMLQNFSENECEMMVHGITKTYKMRLKTSENGLFIGKNEFKYRDIFKIEIGDTSLFHGNIDKHCCMVLLTKSGTIQLEAPSRSLRDNWLRKIQFQYKDEQLSIENWTIDVNIASPTHYVTQSKNIAAPESSTRAAKARKFSFAQNYHYPPKYLVDL